jgi:hypothetical protein
VATAFAGVHLRDTALIDTKVRRNIVLEVACTQALPDFADSLISHSSAFALWDACHDVISVQGAI